MSWIYDGYTYYGAKVAGLPEAQPDDNSCWARALAALCGLSWATVALDQPLDDLIVGQTTLDTRLAVEKLNKKLAAASASFRVNESARWFSKEWDTAMLEKKFPAAVGITDHFVVVMGIGVANSGSGDPRICFWDTDCKVYYQDLAKFIKDNKPEIAFARTARS